MYKIFISLLWFIVVFFFVYGYQYFFIIRASRKENYKKVSVEVQYIITRFKLNKDKVNLDKLVNYASIIAAFDIAFVYTFVISFIKNIYLCLFFIVILLIPTIIISYNLLGKWCIKHNVFDKAK